MIAHIAKNVNTFYAYFSKIVKLTYTQSSKSAPLRSAFLPPTSSYDLDFLQRNRQVLPVHFHNLIIGVIFPARQLSR